MAGNKADFLGTVGGLKRLAAACAGAITPIIGAFAGVAPPWPPGITKLSVVLITLTLAIAWPFASAANDKRRQRVVAIAAAICLVSLCLYLALFSIFVFQVPTSAHTVIVLGCGYTQDARKVAAFAHLDAGFGCPGTYERLLATAQYEAGEIWTRGSIVAVEISMFATWLLTLSAASVGLFTFAAGQKPGPPEDAEGHDLTHRKTPLPPLGEGGARREAVGG